MESRDPGGCGEILGQAILTSGSSRESRGQDHSGGEAMGRASSYGGLIHKYDPITIYFFIFGLFYKPFLCFLSRENTLAFIKELV